MHTISRTGLGELKRYPQTPSYRFRGSAPGKVRGSAPGKEQGNEWEREGQRGGEESGG